MIAWIRDMTNLFVCGVPFAEYSQLRTATFIIIITFICSHDAPSVGGALENSVHFLVCLACFAGIAALGGHANGVCVLSLRAVVTWLQEDVSVCVREEDADTISPRTQQLESQRGSRAAKDFDRTHSLWTISKQ